MSTDSESLSTAGQEAPASRFQPGEFEAAAQAFWRESQAFEADETDPRPKYYCLSMLPYPSGALHMGHVRNYTIGDVISRFKRMRGFNVLQPMGWDAFGLPAENAAIKHGVPPAQWTYRNIEHMREQLERMGFAYDWRREFATCRPDYYRHEQAMFCQLLENGLAYRRNAVVNWDPVDETVLANEQVIDGRGWRSGALVEKREIPQWFLRITDYADELLDGLDRLDGWPDAVRTMQRNWIGRSEGLEIRFDTVGADGSAADPIEVFTTRPDTLFGVTFLSVAAEHPLAIAAAAARPELAPILAELGRGGTAEAELATQEKRGVELGIEAVHPLSGERLPVYAANFVLMGYGTGAVMGVPGHDQRDFEFARAQNLPIQMVIIDRGVADALAELQHDLAAGVGADPVRAALTGGSTDVHRMDSAVETITRFEHDVRYVAAFTEPGVLVNSGDFDGLDSAAAFDAIASKLEAADAGKRRVNYRLRDWGVSRQRYWGCPIPVIHCPACGPVPVPEAELPVLLPEDVEFSGTGSPLKTDPNWRQVSCPRCGGAAERDTDTFDTFMESSWYYARYCSPGADTMVDARARHWLPVDQYIGGIEHAILHLLYFRFYHRLLRDAGFVDSDEPATRLLCQGMVIAETFYRDADDGSRTWFNPAEVIVERDERSRMVAAKLAADGAPVEIGAIEKMSKSKNNGVDPEAMIARFGADTVRLFSMFAAPPDQSLEWSDAGVEGMSRFLKRLTALIDADGRSERPAEPAAGSATDAATELNRKLHETIAKVGDDYERRYAFNTAIAAIMELTNAISRFVVTDDGGAALRQRALEAIVLMLNPIAPHTSHALWQRLGHAETLVDAIAFPEADPAALIRDQQTLAVQVNGKLRATIEVAADADRASIEAAALAEPAVQRFTEGTTIRRVIVVPNKIVNIVCG